MLLKTYLEKCIAAYYDGCPIISDDQYDYLEQFESMPVGTPEGTVKHFSRLYSLRKFYDDEDYPKGKDWYETVKFDGLAIALNYVNGYFVSAVTRGDGVFGRDVSYTINPNTMVDIIRKRFSNYTGQICGEIVALSDVPNSRNYAAGAVRLDSREEFVTRVKNLNFIAYSIFPFIHDTYEEDLEFLSKSFTTVHPMYAESNSVFPNDGKVFRLNNNKEYLKLGFTSKHPRGAYALKTRTEGVETTVLAVEWSTGKSGKVTPVAILEPVIIDDATVSRATLNNPEFIKAMGVKIGSKVQVERAGGIIPRIIRVS